MTEPFNLLSHDELDELVDVDPIRLRDEAFKMRAEIERLQVRLEAAEYTMRTAAPDRDTDLIVSEALKGAEDLLAEVNRLKAFTRRATDRVNELGQLRDHVARDGDTARAERLSFAMQEIRNLFKPSPEAVGE